MTQILMSTPMLVRKLEVEQPVEPRLHLLHHRQSLVRRLNPTSVCRLVKIPVVGERLVVVLWTLIMVAVVRRP